MPSPNPSGRPKGIIDKRQRIQKALADDADALLAVIKAKALEGDMQAAGLLLSRTVPTLRAESDERVQFKFDATQPLAEQLQAITQAVADGEISLEQGKQFADLAARLAEVRAREAGTDDSALINAFKTFAQKVPA